jgi:hypothetical protein
MPFDMNSTRDRFSRPEIHNSSYFANTFLPVEKEVIKLTKKKPDTNPIGRPLWLREINK